MRTRSLLKMGFKELYTKLIRNSAEKYLSPEQIYGALNVIRKEVLKIPPVDVPKEKKPGDDLKTIIEMVEQKDLREKTQANLDLAYDLIWAQRIKPTISGRIKGFFSSKQGDDDDETCDIDRDVDLYNMPPRDVKKVLGYALRLRDQVGAEVDARIARGRANRTSFDWGFGAPTAGSRRPVSVYSASYNRR